MVEIQLLGQFDGLGDRVEVGKRGDIRLASTSIDVNNWHQLLQKGAKLTCTEHNNIPCCNLRIDISHYKTLFSRGEASSQVHPESKEGFWWVGFAPQQRHLEILSAELQDNSI